MNVNSEGVLTLRLTVTKADGRVMHYRVNDDHTLTLIDPDQEV